MDLFKLQNVGQKSQTPPVNLLKMQILRIHSPVLYLQKSRLVPRSILFNIITTILIVIRGQCAGGGEYQAGSVGEHAIPGIKLRAPCKQSM